MDRRQGLLAVALSLAAATAGIRSVTLAAAEAVPAPARLAFVVPEVPDAQARAHAAFWQRLRELGWVEGRNLTVERRWAEGHIDRLPALMTDVLKENIDVLVTYSTPAAVAAKAATATVPVVVVSMGDPVATGVAASLARPGGNVTGLSLGWTEGIPGKMLELMQEIIPHLTTVAVIGNPDSALVRLIPEPLNSAATIRGIKLRYIDVREPEELQHAFEQARRQAKAAIVLPDPLTFTHRQQVISLAAHYKLPVMYGLLEFAEAGGLIAYAPDQIAMFGRAAAYVDKILRGAKPAELPIEQPTQYALTVNLRTARALSREIPQSLLLRADEIIR